MDKKPKDDQDDAELIRRRRKSPQNKGAKIKVYNPNFPQTEQDKKDDRELEKRRKESPENKPQNTRKKLP